MVVMFRGRRACTCLAEWLPVYEKMLLRAGVIKYNIDIAQLIGGAVASGGTHATGGAFDIWQTQWEAVKIARQMGADADWHRKKNWDNRGGVEHNHGVLRGCPHNGPARYQITSTAYGVDHGHNGLANGARDDGPKPLSKRTYKEGIAWANAQMVDADPLEEVMAMYKNKAEFEAAVAKAAAKGVLNSDSIEIQLPVSSPENLKKNPFWQVDSVLGVTIREVVKTRDKVDDLTKMVEQLLEAQDPKA